eukprot:CAMPEP_0173462196 /NCGR_PEP_ID=MMETSP1357-20121228/66256_1 /TAXON_ID=77926 /ORGANISM="Hemiselmis rufescens, Strain PCC563" /LENGTH=144 /DNA_ID=CAMNT_0014429911 /DNA_START=298 /DNA_END=729 /DNA_ORIENTATION=-
MVRVQQGGEAARIPAVPPHSDPSRGRDHAVKASLHNVNVNTIQRPCIMAPILLRCESTEPDDLGSVVACPLPPLEAPLNAGSPRHAPAKDDGDAEILSVAEPCEERQDIGDALGEVTPPCLRIDPEHCYTLHGKLVGKLTVQAG